MRKLFLISVFLLANLNISLIADENKCGAFNFGCKTKKFIENTKEYQKKSFDKSKEQVSKTSEKVKKGTGLVIKDVKESVGEVKKDMKDAVDGVKKEMKNNMSIDQKLKDLKINLPDPKPPVGAYIASKIVGKLYISGQAQQTLKANLSKVNWEKI